MAIYLFFYLESKDNIQVLKFKSSLNIRGIKHECVLCSLDLHFLDLSLWEKKKKGRRLVKCGKMKMFHHFSASLLNATWSILL